jgi:hypothetical protein
MMGHNLTFPFEKKIFVSNMADKNVYPVKMKSLLPYNDLVWSGVDILRNVERSMGGGHLKLTLNSELRGIF